MGSKRVIKHGADSTRQHNSRFVSFTIFLSLPPSQQRWNKAITFRSPSIASCRRWHFTLCPMFGSDRDNVRSHQRCLPLCSTGSSEPSCPYNEWSWYTPLLPVWKFKGVGCVERDFLFIFLGGRGGGCYRVCAELHVSVISALQSTV